MNGETHPGSCQLPGCWEACYNEAAATLNTLLGWLRPTSQYPDKIAEIEAWQSALTAGENPWE